MDKVVYFWIEDGSREQGDHTSMIKDLLMEDRYRFNGTTGFFYNTDPKCREEI